MSPSLAYSNTAGIAGYSGVEKGKACGSCHKGSGEATLSLTGPTMVAPESAQTYVLTVSKLKMKVAGFGATASGGTLTSKESSVKVIDNELVHSQARALGNGESTKYSFTWRAPAKEGVYVLSVAAVAADNNKDAGGDAVGQAKLEIIVSGSADAYKLPPAADAGGFYRGMVGANIMFDGTQSRDADGVIKSFLWDFGDGTIEKGVGNIMHNYKSPGTYAVTLIVTDNDDQSAMAAAVAEIIGLNDQALKPPVAVGGGPYTVVPGESVHFDASASNDPDGKITAYYWEFGDGFTGKGAKIDHIYAAPGMYVAKVTVTDNDGLIASTAAIAKVLDSTTPHIVSFFVPQQVKLIHGPGDAYTQNLGVVAQLYGYLGGDTQICGVVYVERNDLPFRNEVVCFSSKGKATVSYPVTFAAQDAPEVHWTAYLILDSGEKSDLAKASTRVIPSE